MGDRDVLIEEYRSLRSEIMKRQDARLLLVGVSVTGIGALLGLAVKDNSIFIQGLEYQLPLLTSFILFIIVIVLLLTIQQTKQIDILFKALKVSETLAVYLGLFTDNLSKIEVDARKYLVYYYLMLAVVIYIIPIFVFKDKYLIFLLIPLIPFLISIGLACKLHQKGIHGEEFYINYLKDLLNDEDWKIRYRASKALGKIKNKNKAIKPLIEALNDTEENVRDSAAEALVNIGKPVVKSLIQTLKSKNIEIRLRSIEILGKIKDKEATEYLIESLEDKNYRVRGASATALGKIEDKKAVKPLIRVLKEDVNDYVRGEAAKALGKIGDEKVIRVLREALSEDSNQVKISAVMGLKEIDHIDARKIIQALKNLGFYELDYENEIPSERSGFIEAIDEVVELIDKENFDL